MFEISMLPAAHGDCLWIEYGTKAKPNRILIDCGTGPSYPALKEKIESLPENQRHFELFVVTHVDDDHIGGALKFLDQLDGLKVKIDDIWFNSYPHLNREAVPSTDVLGPKQGEKLSDLIVARGIRWNRHFDRRAVVCEEEGELPNFKLDGGMAITLLSPYWPQLEKMKTAWENECKKAGLMPGAFVDDAKDDTLGTAKEVQTLADTPFKADAAPANGSSIAFLAEYRGHQVLFGADAYSPILEKSLTTLGYGSENRLPLAAFKAPHHGSQRNCSSDLIQSLTARNLLISTNGDKFEHPDQEAIARMVVYNEPGGVFHFNYLSEFNKYWKKPSMQLEHKYEAVYPEPNESGILVKIL